MRPPAPEMTPENVVELADDVVSDVEPIKTNPAPAKLPIVGFDTAVRFNVPEITLTPLELLSVLPLPMITEPPLTVVNPV